MIVPVAAAAPNRVLDHAIAALNEPGAVLPLNEVDHALKQAPQDARLWHVKGLIHRDLERRELAIPALKKATELAPADPLIAHGYARTLLEAGLPSVEEFARTARLVPGAPDILIGLASALAAAGRTEEAIEGLERALLLSPLWTDGHTLLASLRWSIGERHDFARSFDRALSKHPYSFDLRRQQLICLFKAEHFDDAMQRVTQGRRSCGEHILFSSHEAAIRSETGDLETADVLFGELAKVNSADIDVWRVRHLLRSARPEDAGKLMERWLRTSDQDLFWPYAATAWHMTGDPRSNWLEGDPQFVAAYDLTSKLPPLDRLANTLRTLHTTRGEFFGQSVRGGTQTDGNLFHRIEPEMVAVREAVRQAVLDHAQKLPPLDPQHPLLRHRPSKIGFSGAWSVRLLAGGRHSSHTHPRGWLSSALYIRLPPHLGSDDGGWLAVGEPPPQLNVAVAARRLIEPKAGMLVLFPSWMWHGTRPFAEGERITVAFDVSADSVPT